ncbi:glycosyltransferase family 2 protein [Ginsengibacter hankyongi]|uniref:Glycosyltransferase family 2 protein n=1 Tax=Ginsengibacter hankyongi TaxID=2607284 RepID=A0A5J5IC54_9BACT|nr:glycosyltransferase family A protein [Ginsengibacter hankyongi]KAA9036392.1 glycosyltransferase family 2 protein [Ginsengibacter hankyongi]
MPPSEASLVSVIVPCYNYAHFLREALDSVMAQGYQNWECIIVNDGSPDNTEEVALEYCKKDQRIKYFCKENGGHSSARNFGIKNSLGKYILPLDPDDKIANYFLEQAANVLDNNPTVKIVCFETQLFGESNQIIKMPDYDLRSLLIVNYLVNTCMYRKKDFEQTKGYDESMLGFEDWNLWINILKSGGSVIELPSIGYYYRKKDVSVFNLFLKDKKRVFRDLLTLYNNHVDVYEKYFDSPITLIQENEKMRRVINAYHQTRTYKWGKKFYKLKSLFK